MVLPVGQILLLKGLVSRPELIGCRVKVKSYDAGSARYGVSVEATGEAIRVKATSLRMSIFTLGFGSGFGATPS